MLELQVSHDTSYAYTTPVSLAHHLAHLQPLQDAQQQLLSHTLTIEPAPDNRRDSPDAQGNVQCHFSLAKPHRQLCVRATSRVRVQPRFAALDAAASPPWPAVAARLRYVARGPFEPALEFALPSPYVPRLTALRAYGAPTFTAGKPVAVAALELMHRIHADLRYVSRSTDIGTPLALVLQQRRGVCQDFAHLMVGVLRMAGLPARYVSGYLLTQAPAEPHDHGQGSAAAGRAMQGADASHAWVQAWCPGTPGVPADGWLDLDPTNDLVPGSGHVRLAVGRDFGDVTPLRGVIRGGGRHALGVAVSTQLWRGGPGLPFTQINPMESAR
ncbi:MAG: transglutaminase family protein [Rubrivivax sp.]|nr:transglutaminase family protein [Rubrivivax sp.]